jgi:hypothetical protein
MRKYLAELPTKPDHHKKRFAFLVSGGVTLSIFAIWTIANFGANGALVRSEDTIARQEMEEVGPIESLRLGLSSGLEGIASAFEGLRSAFSGSEEFEADYKSMRNGVLNTYGN